MAANTSTSTDCLQVPATVQVDAGIAGRGVSANLLSQSRFTNLSGHHRLLHKRGHLHCCRCSRNHLQRLSAPQRAPPIAPHKIHDSLERYQKDCHDPRLQPERPAMRVRDRNPGSGLWSHEARQGPVHLPPPDHMFPRHTKHHRTRLHARTLQA